MIDTEIRALIVADRERVQRLMLTGQEIEVLQHFTSYTVFTSVQVSAVFGFAASHSSMVMRRLFDKGYVTRRRVSSITGGNQYEFASDRTALVYLRTDHDEQND